MFPGWSWRRILIARPEFGSLTIQFEARPLGELLADSGLPRQANRYRCDFRFARISHFLERRKPLDAHRKPMGWICDRDHNGGRILRQHFDDRAREDLRVGCLTQLETSKQKLGAINR